VASAQQAGALPPEERPPEEPAVLDVAAVVVPAQDAAEVPRQAAAVQGAAAVLPRAAEARDAAVVRPQAAGAQDAVAVRPQAARDVEAVLQPEEPDAAAARLRAERASAALPLAVAWVFRRDRVLPSPAP
jgi:hypothetical protein